MRYLRTVALVFLLIPWPLNSSGQGKATVTTSGVPVQLSTTVQRITVCTITAKSTNTGTIWMGFSSAVSAANGIGTPLGPPVTAGQPGASYSCIPAGNAPFWSLSEVWLDATNSGEGVSYTWK